MRSDMERVIINIGRSGERGAYKTRLRARTYDESLDEGPSRLPSSRHRLGLQERQFGDRIQPLLRFLRSNTRRPWDKVYSEIRAQVNARSVAGNHLLEHLRMAVAHNTYELNGEVYEITKWGYDWKVSGFYVHPRTRLLLFAPYYNRRYVAPKVEPDHYIVTKEPLTAHIRLEGIWYLAEYIPYHQYSELHTIPNSTIRIRRFISTPGALPFRPEFPALWIDGAWYEVKSKRQLSRAALIKAGLRNK